MSYETIGGSGPRAGRTTGRQRTTLSNLRSKQTYTALPDPGFIAGQTSQMAALAQQYQSRLAALQGQRANVRGSYLSTLANISGQEVAGAVAAEGSAVERGVLGGSADVKSRIAVKTEAEAMRQDAAMQKMQALTTIAESGVTASNQYMLELARLRAERAAATAQAQTSAYASGLVDPAAKIPGEDNGQVWMNQNRTELQPYYSVASDYKPGDADAWRRLAKKMANEFYGWGADEFSFINEIVMGESEWDPTAVNPTRPAYGIAQTMMDAHFGSDWKTDPAAQRFINDPIYQIAWMLKYITDRYGTPQAALDHKRNTGWY